MIKSVVVAVRDSAIGAFGRPIFAPSVNAALRSFVDEINRESDDNGMAKHPDDYTFHYLADFDEDTGTFHLPEGGVREIARGKDVKRE